MRREEQKLFIGLGTGRCGTLSLRALVDSQTGSLCFHELRSLESAWSGAEESVCATIRELEEALIRQSADGIYVEPGHDGKKKTMACARERVQGGEGLRVLGDIAFYYLNYIELIQDVARFPVAFVCMQRAREEVVASYIRKMRIPSGVRNHWIEHPNEEWVEDGKWDKCYPTFSTMQIEAAIGRYCDDYASATRKLEKTYSNFAVFDMRLLNDKDGREKIMRHIGFADDDVLHPTKPHHENASVE